MIGRMIVGALRSLEHGDALTLTLPHGALLEI